MTRGARQARPGCLHSLCAGVLNLVLLALLVGQGLLLVGLFMRWSTPVAPVLANALQAELAQHGWRLEHGGIDFDATGSILLRSPRVYQDFHDTPRLTADAILLRFDLFGGDPRLGFLRRVAVANATVACPPELPGAESELPLLAQGYVALEGSPFGWRSERLIARQGPLTIRGNMRVNSATVYALATLEAPTGTADDDPRWLARRLAPLLPLATGVALPQELPRWQDATLTFRFHAPHRRDTELTMQLLGARLVGPEGLTLTRARIALPPFQPFTGRFMGSALVEAAQGRDRWRVALRDVAMAVDLDGYQLSGSTWALPPVRARAREAFVFGNRIDRLEARTDASLWPDVSGRFAVTGLGSDVRAKAAVDLHARTAELDVQGLIDPDPLLRHPLIRRDAIADRVTVGQRPRIHASTTLTPGFRFTDADVELWLEDIEAYTIHAERLWATGDVTTTGIVLDRIRGRDDDADVEGHFEQSWAQGDYRILLAGWADPRRFNRVFGSWWDPVKEQLGGITELLYADVEVSGNWTVEENPSLVFLGAHGRHFTWQEQSVEEGRLRLRGDPTRYAVHDLMLRTKHGSLQGDLVWLYPKDEDALLTEFAALRSDLPPTEVNQLLDERLDGLFDAFAFSGRPRLRIDSWLVRPRAEPAADFVHELQIEATAPVTFGILTFPRLSFTLFDRPESTRLQPFRASFCGGRLDATITAREDSQKRPPLQLAFTLEEAQYGEVLAAIGEAPEEATRGVLDLSFGGSGTEAKVAAMEGGGTFMLRDAELGEVHLLGPLTRAFRDAGSEFSYMDIQEATGHYTLANNIVTLEEVNARGTGLRLELEGTADLDTRGLDVLVSAYPLGNYEENSGLGAIFGRLMEPLNAFLQLRVEGTLDAPEWNYIYNPLRLFAPDPGDDAN